MKSIILGVFIIGIVFGIIAVLGTFNTFFLSLLLPPKVFAVFGAAIFAALIVIILKMDKKGK